MHYGVMQRVQGSWMLLAVDFVSLYHGRVWCLQRRCPAHILLEAHSVIG